MSRIHAYGMALLVAAAVGFPPAALSALENDDRIAQAYYMRGSFMELRADLMLAYTYYTYAQKYDPDNARIDFALARVTLEMGKFDEARRYADKLIEKGVYDSDAKLILAEIEYEEQNRDKAIELLESIRDNEDVPLFEVYKFLARMHIENRDFEAARDDLERARDLDPGDLFVHYRLGLIYADLGNIEKAVESLREAIEVNPGFASSYLALGTILLHYGDAEGAAKAFEDALELDPATGPLYQNSRRYTSRTAGSKTVWNFWNRFIRNASWARMENSYSVGFTLDWTDMKMR